MAAAPAAFASEPPAAAAYVNADYRPLGASESPARQAVSGAAETVPRGRLPSCKTAPAAAKPNVAAAANLAAAATRKGAPPASSKGRRTVAAKVVEPRDETPSAAAAKVSQTAAVVVKLNCSVGNGKGSGYRNCQEVAAK